MVYLKPMLDVCYEAHNYFLTLSWISPLRLLEQKANKWNTSDWVTFKQERFSLQRPRGPDLSTVGDCILVQGSFVLCPQMKDGTKASGLFFRRAALSVMGDPSSHSITSPGLASNTKPWDLRFLVWRIQTLAHGSTGYIWWERHFWKNFHDCSSTIFLNIVIWQSWSNFILSNYLDTLFIWKMYHTSQFI